MSGGAAGIGRRGGLAGKDTDETGGGVTWSDFRREDPGGAFVSASTRVHVAGLAMSTVPNGFPANVVEQNSAGLDAGAAQHLYAVPMYFNHAANITRLLCKIASNAAAGGLARMAIYDNSDEAVPYPGARQVDSGDLDCSSAGVKGGSVNVQVAAQGLLWFVWICNATFQTNTTTLLALRPGQLYPILGSQLTDSFAVANDKDSFGVAWRHTFAWNGGALPADFPTSSPVVITQEEADGVSGRIPAIYYGWTRQ